MFHIPRSVECFECQSKWWKLWKVSNRLCERLAKFLAWKNCQKQFFSGIDVFLNLPTGFGKSLVFQMAPLVQAELSRGHATSFPGLLFSASIVVEKRPWLTLVTCLPESGRFTKCVLGDGWQCRPCRHCEEGNQHAIDFVARWPSTKCLTAVFMNYTHGIRRERQKVVVKPIGRHRK